MTSSEERALLRQTVAALVDKHAAPDAVRHVVPADLIKVFFLCVFFFFFCGLSSFFSAHL